jgi:hypothetical protein
VLGSREHGLESGFPQHTVLSVYHYHLLKSYVQQKLNRYIYIQAGFLCAQLAASQATSNGADRVKALGRLTMSYTIGSVIGPSIGTSSTIYILTHLCKCSLVNCVTLDTCYNTSVYDLLVE